MTQLLLSLLGPFQAKIDGQPVTDFPTDKIRALLAYLAVEADKPHRRAALATLLWPDYTDAIALRNLRQSLHRLRQTLDPIAPTLSDRLFTVTRQTLALNSSALTLDVAQIEQALKAVTAHPHAALPECTSCLTLLRTAVGTYQGEFLQGFLVEATPAFEEWQTIRREQLHHQIIEALRHLTLAHEQLRDHQAMYDAAGHLLRLEPWREEAHQWAMRALVLGGQRSEALAQYERCRAVLAAELGVEPSEITTALYQQIQRGQLAPVLAEKSAISMLPPHDAGGGTPLFGFPHGQTKFLGRSAELAQLTGYLVAADYPLVTLVGPGGSGKTRLAIEVAKQHLRQTACFGDGIFFVPLASVVEPSLLPAAIAAAVGLHLHDQSGHRQQLLDFLRNKVLLLVLDNFEQLVAGTTLLVEISAVSPTVKLLVTSRVALNLQREQRLVVGGLGYPTTGAEPPLLASDAHRDAALTHSAVQLFLQSARQVQPDFVVDGETWGAIVQICALVQGMPLALELAATWVRLADCATIVNEISSNLDFLSITAPDLPARHRSMRAVFAHSWQLIAVAERRVLAQLSIFVGGFTLEAMLAVTDGSVVLLAHLLDWSLVQRTTQQRYGLHELLRQFAEAELAAWPAVTQATGGGSQPSLMTVTRQRHMRYFLQLVAQQAEPLYGEQPQLALEVMRRDLDNIRAAWRWAVQTEDYAVLDRAAVGLADFFFLEGLLQEGESLFATAVAQLAQRADPAPSAVCSHLMVHHANFLSHQGKLVEAQPLLEAALRGLTVRADAQAAMAHNALGDLLRVKGDYETALSHLECASAYYESLSQPRGQAQALNNIGQLYWAKSDYVQALSFHQRALQLERQLGNRLGIAQCLSSMGLVYYRQSNYPQALDCHQQALTVATALDNRHDMAKHLSNMGVVHYDQGDFVAATTCLERALAIDRVLGNRLGIAKRQTNLGMIHMRTGAYRTALACTKEAYTLVVAMAHQSGIALTLGNIGVIYWQMGDFVQALAHHEQALAIDEALGNQDSIARHLSNIGATHAELGNLPAALVAYEHALPLFQRLNTRYHWSQALLRKADALYRMGDYRAAADYLREGLAMAQAINRADAIFDGQLLTARLLAADGATAQAVSHLTALLRTVATDHERVLLHDELWQLTQDPFHARRAVVLYDRLLEQSPSIKYEQRLARLRMAAA